MLRSHRFAAVALLFTGYVCTSACDGNDFIVIPRGDSGSAVSAWQGEDDPIVSIQNDAGADGGGAGMGGSASQLDASAPDSAVVGLDCSADSDCFDSNPCNGFETCSNGHCLSGLPAICIDGNPCTEDTCNVATGVCQFVAMANYIPCGAVNKCDGQVCLEGVCTPGPVPTCGEDGNLCTSEVCDPGTGSCVVSPILNGTSCDDSTVCNGRESCTGGVCSGGQGLGCDDGNPCTADACDAVQGCLHAPLGNGTSCSDGNLCNGTEACQAGVCQSGSALTCDDHSPCTIDTCNPQTGACLFAPIADGTVCPDGNLCDGQKCQAGQCVAGTPVVCAQDSDNNRCTTTACVPSTGACAGVPVTNGTSCADSDKCDGSETCFNGVCSATGTPLVCQDDGNPCTDEVCAPLSGCLHVNAPDGRDCHDANLCDGAETCSAGVCSAAGATVVVCNDGNPCTNDVCSPSSGACLAIAVPNGTSCADSDKCDGTEVCGDGNCLSGTPVVCTNTNPCMTSACVPATGLCGGEPVPDGTSCADADQCNGAEICGNGTCLQATSITCTPPAICNPATGTCL